jgi:hypothetical protein
VSLVFRQEQLILRADDDVLEIFRSGAFSERVPLIWLAVQVQPSIKGKLLLRMMSTSRPEPLYQVLPKAKATIFSAVDVIIATEDEPLFRDFFTQVAQSCGRFVAP